MNRETEREQLTDGGGVSPLPPPTHPWQWTGHPIRILSSSALCRPVYADNVAAVAIPISSHAMQGGFLSSGLRCILTAAT